MEYSVLLPVYYKEQPEYLSRSICSMLEQSVSPSEIIILEDGVLTCELENMVRDYENKYENIRVIRYKEHQGLGKILAQGVLECKYDYIARMDSDDISEVTRIEEEWEIIKNNPEISMVGCIYDEFTTEGVEGPIRNLPETPEEILKFAHKRNPFGHSSLLIEKRAILEAGNYREYPSVEDYDLWIRMLMNNEKCFNLQKNLVHVRAGRDFYDRRGGFGYLVHLIHFFKEYREKKFFSWSEYLYTVSARVVVCLVPGAVRDMIYKKFLRTDAEKKEKITSIISVTNAVVEQNIYEMGKAKTSI